MIYISWLVRPKHYEHSIQSLKFNFLYVFYVLVRPMKFNIFIIFFHLELGIFKLFLFILSFNIAKYVFKKPY